MVGASEQGASCENVMGEKVPGPGDSKYHVSDVEA